MMQHILNRRVLVGYLRRRARPNVLLAITSGLLAFAVVFVGTFRESAERAVDDSLRADFGHRTFAVQTGDPSAAAVLHSLPFAAPIQDRMGEVLTGNLSASVLARTTTDPSLRLGIIVDGRRPRVAGEMLISQPLARALRISIGDAIRLRLDGVSSSSTVVGYTIDPSDISNAVVLRLVDPRSDFVANRWLTNRDPYSVAALRPLLDARIATYQSVSSLLESADSNQPQFLKTLRLLPEGSGLLLSVLLFTVILAQRRQWVRDVDALTSAGMARRPAWTNILALTTAVIGFGEVVGTGLAVLAVKSASEPLSEWVAQRWVSVVVPWSAPLAIVTLTVVSAMVISQTLRFLRSAIRMYGPRPPLRWANRLARVTFVLGALTWTFLLVRISGSASGDGRESAALVFSAVVVAASTPFVLSSLVVRALPPATRSLARSMHSTLVPTASAAAAVIVMCTIYVAQTVYDANLGEHLDSPLLPSGSFVVSEVPDSVLPTLEALYATEGGTDVALYPLPDEKAQRLRVTSPSLVACMSEQSEMIPDLLPERCWPTGTASPLNTVALGPPGTVARADPGLIEGGSVGLLLFTGSEVAAQRLAITSAEPDSTLGGLLPGLVIAEDDSLAAEFGLRLSGKSEVALLDFSALEPSRRFFVRASTIRIAAGAETADGTNPTAYDRLRTIAHLVGALGAVAGALLLLLGGAATVLGTSIARRALVDLGAPRKARSRIFLSLIAIPALSVGLMVPLAFQTASLLGQRDDASYGIAWTLPGVAGLVACLLVARAMLAVPPERGD